MRTRTPIRWRSWWLAARMAAWVAILRLAVRVVPIGPLSRWVEPRSTTPIAHDRDVKRIVALSQRATAALSRRPETMCLVRSLVTYRYLARAGARPELLMGFRQAEPQLTGHAWVAIDGQPVTDDPAALANLETSLVLRPRGIKGA